MNVRQFFLLILHRLNREYPMEDFEKIDRQVSMLPVARKLDHDLVIFVITRIAESNEVFFEEMPDKTPQSPLELLKVLNSFLICMLQDHQSTCDECTPEETIKNCFLTFLSGYVGIDRQRDSQILTINSPEELEELLTSLAEQIATAIQAEIEDIESGKNATVLNDITNNPQAILDAGGYKVSDN